MNPSSLEELEEIKATITRQLFSGNSSSQSPSKYDTDKSLYQDKLFYVAEVFEEAKLNGAANNYNYMKNLAKGGVLNIQKSSIEYKKKFKKRFLCIVGKVSIYFKL